MKVAAIDIGSNSIHIIIARVCAQGVIEIIDRDKEAARLGAGTLQLGALSEDAMARGLHALGHFKRLATRHSVDAVLAVATSAVREARNGGIFIERVKKETGIDVRVISGKEEARLIYLGAREVIDFRGRNALVIDIGGGSVEFMLGDSEQLCFSESLKLGVIRLTDRFVQADPLPKEARSAMEGYIQGQAESIVAELRERGFGLVIGTSGTLLNLISSAVAQNIGPMPESLNGARVDREALSTAIKRIVQASRAERLKLPGLDPRRVDTIVAGAVLTQTLMGMLEADGLVGCDRALREGLVVDYIAHHRPGIRLVDAVPDLRRRSVIHLARRCGTYSLHALRVARLARQLFDQLNPVYRLPASDGDLLQYAGMLIDIGYLIDAVNHHKHAYYLIKNGHLDGLSSLDVEILANVVRYHRKALPKLRHEGFAGLSATDRFRVKVLGGILRLAAGLDRSHEGVVDRLVCHVQKERIELLVLTREDGELEVWAANRRSDLLEEALGLPILVRRASPEEFAALNLDAPDLGPLDVEGLVLEA